jgi:hypothetical protein
VFEWIPQIFTGSMCFQAPCASGLHVAAPDGPAGANIVRHQALGLSIPLRRPAGTPGTVIIVPYSPWSIGRFGKIRHGPA